MEQYNLNFSSATTLTEIDATGHVVHDWPIQEGQPYRIVKTNHRWAESPGVTFMVIALPGPGNSIATERLFLLPTSTDTPGQ
jgi:hypothetical protein